MSERKVSTLNCYLTIIILITGVTCDVKFPYNNNVCLNQMVEYQCTVTGSSRLLFLTWKILHEDGTLLDSATYISGSTQSELIIGGVFTVEQLSQSPLISNISFTVQSSINGYTIICEDSGAGVMESSIIQVYDNIPDNVTIHTDTFTNSSVNISWTESSSPCVTGYRYNISSASALEENIIMESTSNSVMVEGLVPSDDQYCVVVTAIDTANRTSSGSDPVRFIFNVPPTPIMITATSITVSDVTDNISVTWTFEYEMTSCAQVPVINFVVSIFNTMNDSMEVIDESEEVPFDVTSFTFEDIPKGQNYTAEVFAVNVVGDGDSIRKFFQGPLPDSNNGFDTSSATTQIPIMTYSFTTSSSATTAMTIYTSIGSSSLSTVAASVNPTVAVTSSINVGAIAGGVAGGLIALLLIIVVIVVIVFFVYRKGQTKSIDLKVNEEGDYGAIALQEKTREVDQALYGNDTTDGGGTDSGVPTYQDPSIIQREQAPTGDLYAIPEKKQPPPTDASTIQREQAPTGELYAIPKKKQSPPTQTAIDTEYAELAELDLTNKSSVAVPAPSQDPSSVIYYNVRAQ